jgi:glycosyltransferase involved in cell wall biosynthesis
LITTPEPQAIADALDLLANDAAKARELGENGRARYQAMDIAWSHVVEALLSDDVTTGAA